MAVTKYVPAAWIESLYAQGARLLGESRPQQFKERAEQLAATGVFPDLEWHFIGTLQRNKVRQVLPWARLIHSVDSRRLLEQIEQVASELQLHPAVLLQVNISGEASKHGFTPEELRDFLSTWPAASRVQIRGLMTMAPDTEDESLIRAVFAGLRELRDSCQLTWSRRAGSEETATDRQLTELSMGMSGDYEIAIEEGATLIRLGSTLFTGCPASDD